jgi:WD40 repeat protein
VAKEDFEWLARDVDGARRVFCLPTRKRDGTTRAGWVTVVVVPDQVNAEPGSNGRPIPSPQLLRDVHGYLEQRGLANLARPAVSREAGQASSGAADLDQIHVSRPGFVEVKVSASVVPKDLAQADNTRNDILRQLREFLDPLEGGPDRQGWEPGRDVYISEIAAEIERVPGVDVIATVSLHTPARQQQLLQLLPDELRRLTGHTNWVVSAAYSPDGTTIVTASHDQTAYIWDASTGNDLRPLIGQTGAVTSAVYSPDGTTIVTASHDQTARIWDAGTGEELRRLTGHTGVVTSAVYCPDGKSIVTASHDQTARIWDAGTGRELRRLTGHTHWVVSAAYSPDGKSIVTASHDQTARIWDAGTGQELRRLTGHTGAVTSAAYSPDGTTIVTASYDKTACIWDGSTGQELRRLAGHTGAVTSAAYSPDGKTIVTASHDQTVRIWDASTAKELRRLTGHTGAATSAVYSPDGKSIVTASHDQTARIWDARSERDLLWDMPAGSQVSTFDERVKLVLGSALPKNETLHQIIVHGLNVGDQVLFVASDGAVQADTRLASQLVDLFEIKFDKPIKFASKAEFTMWVKDLGDAPGLASADGRLWLPIPSMGQNAQFDTNFDPTAEPNRPVILRGVTATGLKAGDRLSVGDKVGIGGAAGSRPIEIRRVSRLDNRFWVVFDLPLDFENLQAFEKWKGRPGEPASLSSSDRRIQLSITGYDWNVDATGRLHLTGVKANLLQRLNVFGLNVGDQVLFIASDGTVQADKHLTSQLVDLFEIKFDRPIEFASTSEFTMWLKDLGDAPGLASADERFWLPIPTMGQNAQFDTTVEPTGTVALRGVTATGLKAGDGLSVGDKVGIVGSAGSQPLEVRRVSQWLDKHLWVVFDLPLDFANEQAFEEWRGRLGERASLSWGDRPVRLPITGYDRNVDATGRLCLSGVIAQGLKEPVSLTHATHRHWRCDFLPVQQVSPWVDQQRVFVPADYLVCSANHEITMVAEVTHASEAA